jgi:hypothetical protein
MTASVAHGRAASRPLRKLGLILAVMASAGLTGLLIGLAARSVAGNRMAPWIVGRAAGVTSYLLLVALVLMGLFLSHPWRSRFRRPSTANRIRLHIVLSVFTLVFTVLHIIVLATDHYAGVGWWGALLPMRASYRPVAVTLGVVGTWSGLAAGVTAALAGRLPFRLWWPIHKVAGVSLVLVWVHGVLGGRDTQVLLWLYLATGAIVVFVAISRYAARTHADHVAELIG